MFMYVSLALLAVTALIVIINVLKGLFRGLKKTIGTLVAIIASAAIALLITVLVCKPSSGVITMLTDLLKSFLTDGVLKDIFNVPELGEALSYYVTMLATPFVFLILYIIISIILSIVVGILVKIIPPHQNPAPLVHKLGGSGVGLVCGLLVSMLVLMPVVGVVDLAASVAGSEALSSNKQISDVAEEASEDKLFSVYAVSCGWMFDGITSAQFDNEKIHLDEDISVILTVVDNIGTLSGGTSNFGEEQVAALNEIVDNLDRSPLLKHTLAGVLSEMASKWSADEPFIGVERIQAGELLDPVIDTILEVLSTSDKNNIIPDMRTLTDILNIFVKYDMFENTENYEAMLDILGQDGVITELMTVANANERMSVLADQITQLSIRALASTIGIPEDAEERYDLLMDEIAAALNSSVGMEDEARFASVKTGVSNALDKYGVESNGQALDHIARSIIDDLGSNKELTASDIKEFFTVYAIASASVSGSEASVGYELLAESDPEFDITENADGTISVNGVVLKNYTASNYTSSAAYTMGKDHVDFGDASSLYSSESMKSSHITLEDILKYTKKYSDCEDPEKEAGKIAEMLSYAVNVFGNDIGSMSKSDMLTKMGELLDMMKGTEIFGEEVTSNLVHAIFQSETVRGDLGLSSAEVSIFTGKLNDTAKGETGSYTSTTQAVSQTIEVVDKISDSNTTKEERRETTEKLIDNMTPENAEVIGAMTTPSMMVQYGTPEEKAEMVAESVTTLFNNMADYKTNTTASSGDEEFAKEADAVNTVLQMAMDSAESTSTSFFTKDEGEESKTGVGAEEFVDLLANSDVVSSTLITTVYENEYNDNPFGVDPTEEDKAALSAALTQYYENNKVGEDDELLAQKLNAIAIIANMEALFGTTEE